METIAAAIRSVLETADPAVKVRRARQVARDWRLGRLDHRFDVPMPDRPARPAEPELLRPIACRNGARAAPNAAASR